jgi:DNA-binding transcriptional ArsR family regulator
MENFEDKCSITVVHEEIINQVKEKLPTEDIVEDLTDFFKSFADATRIKIISALIEAEMCVCDLANLIGMTQSAVSHQLRVLRQSRLVKYRKDGKIVYYSLDDDHVRDIMKQGLAHVKH